MEEREPKVRTCSPPTSFIWENATDVAPTPQQSDAQISLSCKVLRRERAPRGLFRPTTDGSAPPATGLVNPLGSSSFSRPTIERAPAEMESSSTGAAPSNPRLGHGRRAGALTSHILGSAASPTQHEVQQNLFKDLLNHKDRAANG